MFFSCVNFQRNIINWNVFVFNWRRFGSILPCPVDEWLAASNKILIFSNGFIKRGFRSNSIVSTTVWIQPKFEQNEINSYHRR